MSEIKIINPPTFTPVSLDLTIPTQVSFLRKKKLDASGLDLNLLF